MEKPKVHTLPLTCGAKNVSCQVLEMSAAETSAFCNIMKLASTQPLELKSPKKYFCGTIAGTIFLLLKSTPANRIDAQKDTCSWMKKACASDFGGCRH